MSINADEAYRDLLGELTNLPDLVEREEYEAARECALALKAKCAARGIRSGHVYWQLAIACDALGDFDQAFTSVREALRIDPIAPPVWRSYRIIVERMQRTLADAGLKPDDPTVPRLYELLVSADETNADCHLAMARYHRHTGREAEALQLLEALTRLHPAFTAGWRELAATARAAGRPELADAAETETIVRGGPSAESFSPNVPGAQA